MTVTVANQMPDRVMDEDTQLQFHVSSSVFSDSDNLPLTYSATLSDGTTLPDWITFDGSTQIFHVTPLPNFNGAVGIKVTASDGTSSAFDMFNLTVNPVDDPPVFAMPIPDRDAIATAEFRFLIPVRTFTDVDPTPLTYTATLVGGAPLPSWLTFDGAMFDGTPPSNALGEYDIAVTAISGSAIGDSTTFKLRVRSDDAAPIVANPIADQTLFEGQAWTFKLPDNVFTDSDSTGLQYTIGGPGGLALPYWVTFDPTTMTFSGTPPQAFSGDMDIRITADDGTKYADTTFGLHVIPTEQAPTLVYPLRNITVQNGSSFGVAQPMTFFEDINGDPLTFTAKLANGDPLPSWIQFDPTSLLFSGMPPAGFYGSVKVELTANDGTLSTPADFFVNVIPFNARPVLAVQTPNVLVSPGDAVNFQLPAGTFTDPDSPTLTYTVDPLPSWLHFDPATQIFSGISPNDFSSLAVFLTANDGVSNAYDSFAFISNAPVVANQISAQTVKAGSPWIFTVPANTFLDIDTPVLTYSATLGNGSALPSWLTFDPITQTFRGTPPDDWSGHESISVIASDGSHSATDTFDLQQGNLQYDIQGSMWGRSAPNSISYSFDKLFFQTSNDWSTGFDQGFSAGPLYGDINGGVGFHYAFQAGLLASLALKPDTFELKDSINIAETRSTAAQAINVAPFVTVTAAMNNPKSSFNSTANPDFFSMHAFAGVTASVGANIHGGVSGGLQLPSIDLGILGSISFPDITASVGFNKDIDFLSLQAITVANGKIDKPDGNIGAIDVTVKSGDDPFTVTLPKDLGQITFGAPSGVSISSFDTEAQQNAGEPDTLVASGTTDPFASASLDLDQMVILAVKAATGGEVDLTKLFHFSKDFGQGPLSATASIDTDFALVGDVSYKESVSFTPTVHFTMTTSFADPNLSFFNKTYTGLAGDTVHFDTPEGEGTFTVTAVYTSEADLETQLALVGTMHFDMTILKAKLASSFSAGPISFSFPDINLPAAYANTFSIGGLTIPIYSNTDHYILGQTYQDTFELSYEKFRTITGSGNDFTLTSHQVTADGNVLDNTIIGNALDNTINGNGGNDHLDGGGGFNTINGGDGDDVIVNGDGGSQIDTGAGNNTVTAGSGDDNVVTGDGNNVINLGDGTNSVQAGNGNNTITTGSGPDSISTGNGNNTVNAGDGDNNVNAGAGNDVIVTGIGADSINGGGGSDHINAGAGNDTLNGGAGHDMLTGGLGSDKFIFDLVALADAQSATPVFDEVTDFDRGSGSFSATEGDTLDVHTLIAGSYFSGQALDALVRLVEDPSNAHALLQVDSDGTANGIAWTTIAQLDDLHVADSVNVIVDRINQPHGTPISVLSNAGHFGDMNGDGMADLVWRNDDGVVATWQMNGGSAPVGNFLTGVSSDWHILGTGDFDGDGKTDILWQNDNGSLIDWSMNSASQIGGTPTLGSTPADSVLAGIGDVDHDGKSDLIWRTSSGGVTIDTMAGASNTINAVGNDWSVVGVGDFNGDGKADIMFRNASLGTNAAWLMNGTSLQSAVFYPGVPNDWHVEATGDFNGDGTADLFWHNDNGGNAVWLMKTDGNIKAAGFFDGVGADWHVVGSGDFTGDHKDDLIWRNDAGATAVWQMNGTSAPTVTFPGGVPGEWTTQAHHYDYV